MPELPHDAELLSWLEGLFPERQGELHVGSPHPLARSNLVRPIYTGDSATPIAILKSSPTNPSRLLPEQHALTTIEELGIGDTPTLLGACTGHVVLSYVPHRSPATSCLTIDLAGAIGRWLARAHAAIPPPSSRMKLLHDPLPLPQRLERILAKATRRAFKRTLADAPRQRQLVQDAATRFEQLLTLPHVVSHLLQKRVVHRDLNPENILIRDDPDHAIAVIDFERAAATAPAWDFAKLCWWVFDALPDRDHLLRACLDAYGENLEPPPSHCIELFQLFEATTLLCYFETPCYVRPAERILEALLQLPVDEPRQLRDLPSW